MGVRPGLAEERQLTESQSTRPGATSGAAAGAGGSGQWIPIMTAPNLRDLGGWPVGAGGSVRRGVVYRSAELAKLGSDDAAAFAALRIRTVYDLRTEVERASQPDHLPAGVELTVLDVLADEAGAAPAQLTEALHDPQAAAAA